jgi:Nuclear transport factor 2 (NTF2) domain
MPFTRTDVLSTVERSPAAASARDRSGWLDLFTSDARIEDPVGSAPHSGRVAIGRFFDTFIGPRDVAYLPDTDIVAGSTVIRDGVLQAALGSVVLRVPIYLRYDLVEDDGVLKIAALNAFWELPAMVGKFLRGGVGGAHAGLTLATLLLRNQGIVGALGFLRGFRGAGQQGKRRFREFLADAQSGDEVAVRRRLAKGARVTLGDDRPMPTAELLSRLAGGRPRKLIAAGHHFAVGIERDGRRDVLFADVDSTSPEVQRIRYFSEKD